MGIEWMIRGMKIRSKLLLTYLIVLLVTFMVTSITFNFLVQNYLEKETRQQLRLEAQSIAETLKKDPLGNEQTQSKIIATKQLKIAGRFMESKFVLVNHENKVVFTNLDFIEKKDFFQNELLRQAHLNGYITERIQILTPNGEVKGYIFLLAAIRDLQNLRALMSRTQLFSFLLAGVFAIIVGWIFQRGITGSIHKLKEEMSNFSVKNNQLDLDIDTGDEIEDLANCFLSMTDRLIQYDKQQKSFFQNASHELKTPLASIQGYAEAIKDGVVEGEEMEQSLEIIIVESQRLKKTVEELLYLTKLENVEEIFYFEEVNLEDIIQHVLRSIKPLAKEKGILIVQEGNWDWIGKYDRDKLLRALINLLSNALRYGRSKVVLQCEKLQSWIEILILDDGTGFKEGEESKIFERFYKGERGNSGIGLTITRAIIEGHGGTIQAYNNTKGGAVIKIKIPHNSSH